MSATAWVFPGQGSQSVGMGKTLAETESEARQRFAEADDALGFALSDTIWNGPDATLQQTDTQQPAMLVVSVVQFEALLRRGALPDAAFAAGHSLGQYSAAVCTGALPFAEAVRLVRRRGQLMQEFGHGAMAAILGMETAAVQALAAEAGVEVANINAPGQVTIAGRQEDVERAATLAKERGARRAIMLPVSAAFHTSLMRPVADALAPLLQDAKVSDPVVSIMANVDGQPIATAADLRAELIQHIRQCPQRPRQTHRQRGADADERCASSVRRIIRGRAVEWLFLVVAGFPACFLNLRGRLESLLPPISLAKCV
ncbi:MAG: ACP S-malonyltransferase [Thermomicrobia bacterium]|nr:ACP S-malonyltransferase [Thermomicrobia bacterium]